MIREAAGNVWEQGYVFGRFAAVFVLGIAVWEINADAPDTFSVGQHHFDPAVGMGDGLPLSVQLVQSTRADNVQQRWPLGVTG